jgi:LysM repeat protein
MKKQLLTLLLFFIVTTALPQAGDLMIRSGSKGFYLEHIVAPRQGLFPIGRLYNVHPRHIAAFNNLDFNKGLAIGQHINIPLTDTNFSQTIFEGVPVYYPVREKESLANISVTYKTAMNNLRVWNLLTNDNIAAGTNLIVGFLITKEMRDRAVKITPKTFEPEPSVSEVKKMEAQKKELDPEVKKDEPVITEPVISKKTEIKKEPEIKKEETPVINEEPPKENQVISRKEEKHADDIASSYFKGHFDKQIKQWPVTKDQTVTSGIFKTTSGWEDHKYYLLAGGIEPGTIVRIINPSNNKIVFAKVLSGMEVIRPNQGLDVRISDAAAAALAISETDKFIVKMNY